MKNYFFVLIVLHYSSTLFAQQGVPDATFGNGGYALIPRGGQGSIVNEGKAIAIQPDGKIVVAGPGYNPNDWLDGLFQVTRLNANGTRDATFGANGVASIEPSEFFHDGGYTTAYGVALQSDGKIVVAGSMDDWHDFAPSVYRTAVVRLNANGTLDNTFDGNGKLLLQLSSSSLPQGARDVAIQADGKIVITGVATVAPVGNTLFVVRVTSTGVLDNTFNGSGVLYADFATPSIGYGLKIQPDGKIVVTGQVGGASNDVAVIRLNTDGTYDNSFDLDGKAVYDITGTNDAGYDVDVQSDGRIVIGGSTTTTATHGLMLRLNSDGTLDNNFDGDGKLTINAGSSDVILSVVVQPDGKILGGGNVGPFATMKLLIVKLNSNGSPDTGFDGDGMGIYAHTATDFFSGDDIALQSDGKIVATGSGSDQVIAPTPFNDPVGRVFLRLTNQVAVAGPLPVSLVDFNVRPQNTTAILEWSTAWEQNSDRFEILHSANARDFKKVGELKASGNSSVLTNYRYIDISPAVGLNYYRLLMKDVDGKTSLSEIKKVNIGQNAFVELSPNPANGLITVKYQLPGVKEITVLDMYGRTVMQQKPQSSYETTLNIQLLPAGVYTVVISHGGGKLTSWFTKN
jgi:uncharacterized delta-60 repeat protein